MIATAHCAYFVPIKRVVPRKWNAWREAPRVPFSHSRVSEFAQLPILFKDLLVVRNLPIVLREGSAEVNSERGLIEVNQSPSL